MPDIVSKGNQDFYNEIKSLLKEARANILQSVNTTLVQAYFSIGKRIVEKEQGGNTRADYGQQLMSELSRELSKEFGRGFSRRNIEQMRQFYMVYANTQTVSAVSQNTENLNLEFTLSWSHYLKLMRIDDKKERRFYELEARKNNWSIRELQRQFDSALYTRLALSADKNTVLRLSEKGQIIEEPKDVIKDPYILEFVGLPEQNSYSETELEESLINKLESFLLELGNGFTFVARQKRISFEDKHFRIDLVFYNRLLKCFVLIHLKIGELKHQDLGQMLMYVNYYDRETKLPDQNKTIGLVLCQGKSDAVVQYTLPEENEQIFASKYQTVLPSKEELTKLLKDKNKR